MTQMRLDLIKPSSDPIRKTWDEEKMEELAQSIREQGVIVPIKVRPSEGLPRPCRKHGYAALADTDDTSFDIAECSDCIACGELVDWTWAAELDITEEPPTQQPFEIVYGHRRTEAARRAGLAEVPVIIEGMEDDDALIQALIENVQREDMSDADEGAAYKLLIFAYGLTQAAVARKVGKSAQWVSRLVNFADDPTRDILHHDGDGANKAEILRGGLKSDTKGRIELSKKAVEESLARPELKNLMNTYIAAEDDAERQAVIDTPYHDPAFEQLVRAKASIARREFKQEIRDREENPREVKEFLDAIKMFTDVVDRAKSIAKFGKFSPEAKRFTVSWIDGLIRQLSSLKETLGEDSNAKAE